MLFTRLDLTQSAAIYLWRQKLSIAFASLFVGFCSALTAYYVLQSQAKVQMEQTLEQHVRIAWNELHRLGTEFHEYDGTIFVGDNRLYGRLDIVDNIARLTGGVAEIYHQDKRIATSLKLDNGKRATAVQLLDKQIEQIVFQQKTSYRGKASVLGDSYITAYDPVMNPAGEVIGMVLVATRLVDFYRPVRELQVWIGSIAIMSALLGMLVAMAQARISFIRSHTDHESRALNRDTGEKLLMEKLEICKSRKMRYSIALLGLDPQTRSLQELRALRKLLRQVIPQASIIRWGAKEFMLVCEGVPTRVLEKQIHDLLVGKELAGHFRYSVAGIDPVADRASSGLSHKELISAVEYRSRHPVSRGHLKVA